MNAKNLPMDLDNLKTVSIDKKASKMKSFTIPNLGLRIRNKWITDGLSEIISTFLLALFVYASGAQYILSHGTASSPMGRALTSGAGLTLAVYTGYNASGGAANPCIALMFCLLGKMPWKKYPLYVFCEFVGAFIAAALTYGIYYDLINAYDGGVRSVVGATSTSHIFCSYPHEDITKTTGFFDIMVGCGLLTGLVAAVIDPRNAGVSDQLIPLIFTFLLYAIIMAFGLNTGTAINMSIDLCGRLLCFAAGYGSEVWTRSDYWFWVPPVACVAGTFCSCFIYQLMVGNHLPEEWEVDSKREPDAEQDGKPALKAFVSTDLSTISNETNMTSVN